MAAYRTLQKTLLLSEVTLLVVLDECRHQFEALVALVTVEPVVHIRRVVSQLIQVIEYGRTVGHRTNQAPVGVLLGVSGEQSGVLCVELTSDALKHYLIVSFTLVVTQLLVGGEPLVTLRTLIKIFAQPLKACALAAIG